MDTMKTAIIILSIWLALALIWGIWITVLYKRDRKKEEESGEGIGSSQIGNDFRVE